MNGDASPIDGRTAAEAAAADADPWQTRPTDGPGRPQTDRSDTGATATRIGPATAEFRAPATHAGPYHDVTPKRQLAIHLGVWHRTAGGRYLRIAEPGAAVRSRWKLDDLRAEHRRLHENEEPPE